MQGQSVALLHTLLEHVKYCEGLSLDRNGMSSCNGGCKQMERNASWCHIGITTSEPDQPGMANKIEMGTME